MLRVKGGRLCLAIAAPVVGVLAIATAVLFVPLLAPLSPGHAPGPAAHPYIAASSGVLGESTSGSVTFSITLNGSDLVASSTALHIVVTNTGTGSDGGWNLTLSATALKTSGSPQRTLGAEALAVVGATGVCDPDPSNTGCVVSTTTVTYSPPIVVAGGAPAVKVYVAAAGSGIGTIDVTPALQLSIPANAYAGTYTGTITITVVSGP